MVLLALFAWISLFVRWPPNKISFYCQLVKLQNQKYVALHTAQMTGLVVFCGPHLPLAFQFVCGPPPSPRAENTLEGKWKVRPTKNHENRH